MTDPEDAPKHRLLLGRETASDDPLALAQAIAQLGPREAVIKLGHRGSVALIEGETVVEPALTVAVVDTVGAGDAFVAGYLASRLTGGDALARVRQGVTAGAFACLHAGDWEGLPRSQDLALLHIEEPVSR